MQRASDTSLPGAVARAFGEPAGSPFRRDGLLVRVLPFAVVAALAEASLALPPGALSWPAAIASIVALLATAAAFALPWSSLPGWLTVLVPLAYSGSVLALILAAGPTSGVGVVLLIPLVWTALFHRPWESAVIVAAVVMVEVIISLTPVVVPGAVIGRRVLLWGALGALISVATHGLRSRIRRTHDESAGLQAQLREVSLLRDRDRIAADLQDKVIQRIFAAGLALQSASAISSDAEVRRRIDACTDDLDDVLRTLRDTIFGLERRLQGRGLRQEILDLCGDLSPVPEISFAGPVDGALHPGTAAELVELLREAIGLVSPQAMLARIGVTVGGDSVLALLEAGPAPGTEGPTWPDNAFSGLSEKATLAGVDLAIEVTGGSTARFSWQVPLRPAG